jgi:hypothetical protein
MDVYTEKQTVKCETSCVIVVILQFHLERGSYYGTHRLVTHQIHGYLLWGDQAAYRCMMYL